MFASGNIGNSYKEKWIELKTKFQQAIIFICFE